MHLRHHPLLSSFRRPLIYFAIIILLIISLRSSSAKEYDIEKYTNCSRPYQCGTITTSFPFWGHNRPRYCGHPKLQLQCKPHNITSIVIGTTAYQVMNINNETETLNIADDHSTICPAEDGKRYTMATGHAVFTNNVSLFDLDKGLANGYLIFYFNCTSVAWPTGNYLKFNCSSSGGVSRDLYIFKAQLDLSRCSVWAETPILESAIREFWMNSSNLSEQGLADAVNKGFQAGWTLDGDDAARCRGCRESGGQCGYNSTVQGNSTTSNFVCFYSHDDFPAGWSCLKKTVTGVVVGGVGTIFTCCIFIFFQKKRISQNKSTNRKMEDFFKDYGSQAPKRFKYKDVKKITNSFSEKLGQGGFGDVFKGQLHDGRLVAVKVLLTKSKNSDGEDFMNEIASISRTCHVNIVTLLGFCVDGKKKALIYEFMSNGSLEKFIYNKKQISETGSMLGCETLYQIAIGIARGLEYLHRGCTTRILHFDIKPHNILLDEDFRPKISDFGLSKLCPGKESIISMLGARGTPGYIAPEVFNRNFGGVSHKSDVYSYGMMVLEMVGGRKNFDVKVATSHSSQLYFPEWIHDHLQLNEGLGLQGIMTEEREKTVKKMILVGLWCIQTNQSDRPSMSKVLEMLEGNIEALPIPPKPFLASPPSSPSVDHFSSTTILSALNE